MKVSGVGQYLTTQDSYAQQKRKNAVPVDDKKAGSPEKDTVTISGSADYLQSLQKQFPQMRFSVGMGFAGKTSQNTGDNADRWAFTISPKLLEKMSASPEAEAEYTQMLRDIERATALADSLSKAAGMKTVYCENYIDENGKLHHISVSVREDQFNEKLRAEAQKNMEKLIERIRGKNMEAASKLEELLNKAEETGALTLGDEDMRWIDVAAKALEDEASQTQDNAGAEEEAEGAARRGGRVGINAGKLARMLAAAKTRAQVQAVMAKIQADLRECDAGKNQGMDVEKASVAAAEQLLQEAKSRMGSAENREATPQEEMAFSLSSLM